MEKEFLQTINEHQGIIAKVCRMHCTTPADAEDLFQEIVLQLWKAWPAFNRQSKVSTWLYRISLNTAITRFRRSRTTPVFRPLGVDSDNYAEPPPQRIDVQYAPELQQAISRLNKFDKSLLLLYLDDKTYSEIAEILGLSISNVGVKINRIKKKLKEMLQP
ncbi:sigma-70 family RNA polymerase sigma factor [Chitinophaga filiformis]|uniref:RNA polymerase sigma factor n=1 Tax=Chitinophaga filiformis TaxID=104663 RepID=UPI001F1A85E8|nr:sigma-70 family RNA polymerase sigma factor [Chitinophaga filiformis]MCF6407468.1 sigma-70 family RNA polymerase sigma factor [Chitinophaga filiformis]